MGLLSNQNHMAASNAIPVKKSGTALEELGGAGRVAKFSFDAEIKVSIVVLFEVFSKSGVLGVDASAWARSEFMEGSASRATSN